VIDPRIKEEGTVDQGNRQLARIVPSHDIEVFGGGIRPGYAWTPPNRFTGTGPGVISSDSMGGQAARGKSRGGRAALRDIGRLAAGIQPMTVRYSPTRATITVPTFHQGATPTALFPMDR
jgi:hypothetical protein